MAARRLLIVMLILLGISSVIAIVVPERQPDDSPPAESAVTGETGATGSTGEGEPGDGQEDLDAEASKTVAETVNLDAGKPRRIKARAGSRMILTVTSENGSEVEIEGVGRTGFADPYAPAVFDLILPPEPGRYQVRAPEGKTGTTIVTS